VVTTTNGTGIIVADDDTMIRSILRASFEALDLNVLLASDGLEAVEFASRIQAALIILDLKMPRLNGMLACQQIRQLPGHEQTPIVILTALPGKDPETAAARVGATGYFVKPFRPALLLQALAQFLPINDVKRDVIRRNADRASGIVGAPPAPVGDITSGSSGSAGLNRGKDILNALRS
jgi:CheY-like chemotaxis protein